MKREELVEVINTVINSDTAGYLHLMDQDKTRIATAIVDKFIRMGGVMRVDMVDDCGMEHIGFEEIEK